MKPATTTVVVRRFCCLRRTTVSVHPSGIERRLHQVARHVVEQVAAMAETQQQEVSAQE